MGLIEIPNLFQETADEGQGNAELESTGGVTVTQSSTANTSTLIQSQQPQQTQQPQPPPPPPPPGHSPPTTASSTNPLTVKDLMLGVIEMQLKRNNVSPAGPPGSTSSSGSSSMSNILKADHRNDITFVREFKPASSMPSTAISNRDSNLATLSVVSCHRSAPSPQQIGKTFFKYFNLQRSFWFLCSKKNLYY